MSDDLFASEVDFKDKIDETDPENATIMNPLTGDLYDTNDTDELIKACVDVKSQIKELQYIEGRLRDIAGRLTEGDTLTRYLHGRKLRAKVVFPSKKYNDSILKEAWHSYPQFRENYLKIGRVSAVAKEVKKLEKMTSDDPAFQSFKSMVLAAVETPTTSPTVSVDEDN